MATSTEAIVEAVTPVLNPLGLLVEDVTVIPAGKRRLVRVLVDRVLEVKGGVTAVVEPVTLDEVTDATRSISEALDESNVMGEQPYVLEVSSPGTDRPLTQPRHFARNVSRLVVLTVTEPVESDGDSSVVAGQGSQSKKASERKLTGRIVSANEVGVVIEPQAENGKASSEPQLITIDYPSITRASVQVEFTRGDDAEAVGEDQ